MFRHQLTKPGPAGCGGSLGGVIVSLLDDKAVVSTNLIRTYEVNTVIVDGLDGTDELAYKWQDSRGLNLQIGP